jgi:hypothetical protein
MKRKSSTKAPHRTIDPAEQLARLARGDRPDDRGNAQFWMSKGIEKAFKDACDAAGVAHGDVIEEILRDWLSRLQGKS